VSAAGDEEEPFLAQPQRTSIMRENRKNRDKVLDIAKTLRDMVP